MMLNFRQQKTFNSKYYGDVRHKIERFCLPVFSALDDDYALDYVINNYPIKPSMSQIYFGYLSKMIRKDSTIADKIENIFNSPDLLFDYQRKWLYATLLFAEKVSEVIIKYALIDLQNPARNNSVRSICAILVGKYGSAAIRQILKNHYSNENSEYVKASVLYAAQYFPIQQKDTCFKAWSGHNELNSLIVAAIKKK